MAEYPVTNKNQFKAMPAGNFLGLGFDRAGICIDIDDWRHGSDLPTAITAASIAAESIISATRPFSNSHQSAHHR